MLTSSVDIAHFIQLAVAPVFLLAGIAGFLGVMSSRLGRIIDRSRVVNRRLEALKDCSARDMSKKELKFLYRRSSIINKSIALCTGSALLVCLLIVCLFVSSLLDIAISSVIVSFFTLSMVLLIAALLFFLKEVQLSIRTLTVAREYIVDL